MSSPMTTSHFPAGPLGAFLSALNSAIPGPLRHHFQHDLLGGRDVLPRQPLRLDRITREDRLVTAARSAPPALSGHCIRIPTYLDDTRERRRARGGGRRGRGERERMSP